MLGNYKSKALEIFNSERIHSLPISGEGRQYEHMIPVPNLLKHIKKTHNNNNVNICLAATQVMFATYFVFSKLGRLFLQSESNNKAYFRTIPKGSHIFSCTR